VFIKIFLNDFTIFNDLSTPLKKLKNYFLKCKEYDIGLNPDKCASMVCSRTILGFIVSKKGKTYNLKKIEALVSIQCLKHLKRFKSSMEWPSFTNAS
jgi:hypothetical protein